MDSGEPISKRVEADEAFGDAFDEVPLDTKLRARRASMTVVGAGLVVVGGPVVGVLTPMLPLGFVVAGFGAGMVVRNSPRGKRIVETAWSRYPKVTDKCPPKVRAMIFGAD